MCGRYTWTNPQIERFCKYTALPKNKIKPRYNRAPGQQHPILYTANQEVSWTEAKWGNHGGINSNRFPINARAETADQKPTFEQSFLTRRCLVPADGYYEWQIDERDRKPHFFHLSNHSTFAFAGLWSEGDSGPFFTILTRSAHGECLHIHHRMPVILSEKQWDIWMDNKSTSDRLHEVLSKPAPRVEFYPVTKLVNGIRLDGPELLKANRDQQGTLF